MARNIFRTLFLTLFALAILPLACVGDRGGQAGADHSEVLDTSSPDEPGMTAAPEFSTAAAATNLFLHASDSNQSLRNVVLHGTSYTGPIVVSSGQETLTNIEYRRWSITNDIALGQNAKWGILLYNEVGCRYVGVRVSGIKAEHGIYQHSPRGNVTLSDCVVFDVGAQGFQQTWRGAETSDPVGWQKTGTHRLERCSFVKCGQPRGYGRASYAVSMFGWQAVGGTSPRQAWDCPVELIDVLIEHDSQGQYELRGALLVEWRPSVLMQRCRINYLGQSDRDLVHFHMNKAIRVENSYFHGPAGKFWDIDGADSVVFTSVGKDGGDVKVRIDGVTVGSTDDEISWHR